LSYLYDIVSYLHSLDVLLCPIRNSPD
jgi:hypothetical protein